MSTRTPPKAHSWTTAVAVLLALLLVAAGIVGIHDLLAGQGWVAGGEWVPPVVSAFEGLRVTTWMVVVAVLVGLLGLWLVLLALKPRRRTHVRSADDGLDLWTSPKALAAIAGHAADRIPGVASATARAHRRRIDVEVRADDGGRDVAPQVKQAVEHSLDGLTTQRVRVHRKEVTR